MKKLLTILLLLVALILNSAVKAQTVSGKLVDQNGSGLSGMQLKLYISPKVYDATSSSDGSFTFANVTDVKDEQLPTGYSISDNYPNPFNPKTRIGITLPEAGTVRINVYNLLGQIVMDEIVKDFSAGTNNVDLELKGLPNGIYLARITINDKYTSVKKLMLLYGSQHLANSNSEPILSLSKIGDVLATKLDSIIVTNPSITRTKFGSLPQMVGTSLNLGNLVITTSAPSAPKLSIPSDNSINIYKAPLLSWNQNAATVKYTIQLSTSSSFTSYLVNQEVSAGYEYTVSGLQDSTRYYWRVNAINNFGTSSWSETRNFITTPKASTYENTVAQTIGVSGGVVNYGDGTKLTIPEGAVGYNTQISISKLKNEPSMSQSGNQTIRLEPSGITLSKPLMLETKYETYNGLVDELLNFYTFNENTLQWEKVKILSRDKTNKIVQLEVTHFSWIAAQYDHPLELVMEIPGKYLKKGDLIYALVLETIAVIEDKTFDWFPAHAGLYLGTVVANSTANDGKTTIESSQWPPEKNVTDGVQFNTLDEFMSPSDAYTNHLYMGARRFNGTLTDADRTKIAEYAIGNWNSGYMIYGQGNFVAMTTGKYSFSCVGITEASYDYAGKSIIPGLQEFPFITPVEQFNNTEPVDEISAKANEEIVIPVKGVVWNDGQYTTDNSKYTLNITNLPTGATFTNGIFKWTPTESQSGSSYNVKFTASAKVFGINETRNQDLKIIVTSSSSIGLVAYYPFNGNANDESGNGNNGTVTGAILTKDRYGNSNKAYSFTAANQYIRVPQNSSLEPNQAISISLWLNRTDIALSGTVIRKSNNQSNGYFIRDNISFTLALPNNVYSTSVNYLPFCNAWHHIVATYNYLDGQKLYIDGVLVMSRGVSGLLSHTGDLFIGGASVHSLDGWANGSVDDVRIYNRALSEAEIKSLYTENGWTGDNSGGGSSCVGVPTVTYGGETYETVQIGTQCWLKKNLNIGTMIQNTANASNNSTIEKYCYDNKPEHCNTYGGLYKWNEVMAYSTTPGTKGICPDGWHIPTKEEFETLAKSTAVNINSNTLKAIGQGTGSGAGTNTSGFSALLAGYRNHGSFFGNLGDYTYFWSSTEYNTNFAYTMHLLNSNTNIYFNNGNKEDGFNVRCVKD